MEIRRVDPEDTALLRRFWEVGKAAENASRPYDLYVPWETAETSYRTGRPGFQDTLVAAFDGEQMLGRVFLRYPVLDNLHLAIADVHVHPDHQRRGVGRALVAWTEQRARTDGRRVLLSEAYSPVGQDGPGLAFASALGFSPALEDGMKLVDLVETEPTWSAVEAEVSGRAAGYTLVSWRDRVPDQHLPGVCALNEAFNDLAPSGDLELEPEVWTEARVREDEAQNGRIGRHVLAVGAVTGNDGDGALVGLTEIVVNEHAPGRGFQSGTLVLPEHRGHALGLAMKLANHRAVREAFPECRVLVTGNAGTNAAMNAVNDRLGYREIERCVEVQKELAPLD